jgi:hypothetical protein
LTFIGSVYVASRVFKRGILQYGKAMRWADIFGLKK